MKFCIFTTVDHKFKTLLQWDEQQILKAVEERLGKEKAKVFKEIMYEFKKETITIP